MSAEKCCGILPAVQPLQELAIIMLGAGLHATWNAVVKGGGEQRVSTVRGTEKGPDLALFNAVANAAKPSSAYTLKKNCHLYRDAPLSHC